MNREVVKELIQQELTVDHLTKELNALLNNKGKRIQLENDYHELKKLLGGAGASQRTAQLIYKGLTE